MGQVTDLQVPDLFLFIPTNPFAELTGAHPTSIISVVIFAVFLGMAGLNLIKADAEKGKKLLAAIEIMQAWVMKLVRLIMTLTPYAKMRLNDQYCGEFKIGGHSELGWLPCRILYWAGHYVCCTCTHFVAYRCQSSSIFKKVWPVLTFAY